MSYLLLKHLHITCVVLSGFGFLLRGALMLADSPLRQRRVLRIAPHLIDTVLLVSAIGLTLSIGQYPFVNAWLTAKLFGLLAYIGLGTMALKRGRTRAQRATYFGLALLVFTYIVSVALRHQPSGFF